MIHIYSNQMRMFNSLGVSYFNEYQIKNIKIFSSNNKKDPCSTLKCATNELCVLKDADSAVCLLRKDMPELPMFINKRQVKTTVCSSQDCKYGQCEIVSPDGYKCHCDNNGIVGTNCDTFLANSMPCASNPCWGNSECVNLDKYEYDCKCKAGRGGKDCIGHIVSLNILKHLNNLIIINYISTLANVKTVGSVA